MAHPLIEAAIDRYLMKERARARYGGVRIIDSQFTNNATAIRAESGVSVALNRVSFADNGIDLDLGDNVRLDAREITTERSI